MADKQRTIAILTGGGDVPGLNPAIRAITIRALREGYRVVGIRRGWAGLVDYQREAAPTTPKISRSCPRRSSIAPAAPAAPSFTRRARGRVICRASVCRSILSGYDQPTNDVTKDVLKNLEHIGVDVLIPIGGDDTLSYGKRLHDEGVNVVAIPKTMDNDVYGTDYCIGFSTCVTRTIELTHQPAHVGGFARAVSRDRGVRPLRRLHRAASDDGWCGRSLRDSRTRRRCRAARGAAGVRSQPESKRVLGGARVRRGALKTHEGMSFEGEDIDMFGHRKLGGIGDKVAGGAQGVFAAIQQGPAHRCRQPATRLSRSLRRS